MWDSSLILQGLTSHQRTSPEEHMFSAEFGGLYDNGFRNAAETKSLRVETLKLLGEGGPPRIDVEKE